MAYKPPVNKLLVIIKYYKTNNSLKKYVQYYFDDLKICYYNNN